MPIKKVISRGVSPVKIWTDDIDDNAMQQLENMSKMKFIHKHIAAMPDVHWGMGATIVYLLSRQKGQSFLLRQVLTWVVE